MRVRSEPSLGAEQLSLKFTGELVCLHLRSVLACIAGKPECMAHVLVAQVLASAVQGDWIKLDASCHKHDEAWMMVRRAGRDLLRCLPEEGVTPTPLSADPAQTAPAAVAPQAPGDEHAPPQIAATDKPSAQNESTENDTPTLSVGDFVEVTEVSMHSVSSAAAQLAAAQGCAPGQQGVVAAIGCNGVATINCPPPMTTGSGSSATASRQVQVELGHLRALPLPPAPSFTPDDAEEEVGRAVSQSRHSHDRAVIFRANERSVGECCLG